MTKGDMVKLEARNSKAINLRVKLALLVLDDQVNSLDDDHLRDLSFLFSWYLCNKMVHHNRDDVLGIIENYLTHLFDKHPGEPLFCLLRKQVDKDPRPLCIQANIKQGRLASEAGLGHQNDVSRHRNGKRKRHDDKVLRMTVILAIRLGYGEIPD